MTYAIGSPCVDVMDKFCVEECPVDAIYEGARKLYINPDECIDCGACAQVCPTGAVTVLGPGAPADALAAEDRRFFAEPLPGRDRALGSPGGATATGVVGTDTEAVSAHLTSPTAGRN